MEKELTQAKVSEALDQCFMDTLKSFHGTDIEVSALVNGILSFTVHRLAHTIFLYKPKDMSCEQVINVVLPELREALMFKFEYYNRDKLQSTP